MISPEYLASAYERNVQIVKRQTDGLSQVECLGAGGSAKWPSPNALNRE